MKKYLRGDLFYADLGQGVGSEQSGIRPVLIIQNNVGNRHSPTVIVASVTGKADVKPRLPTHCCLAAGNGLKQPSLALLEQLRTLDKRRLSRYIGTVSQEELQGIDRALSVSIGLLPPTAGDGR